MNWGNFVRYLFVFREIFLMIFLDFLFLKFCLMFFLSFVRNYLKKSKKIKLKYVFNFVLIEKVGFYCFYWVDD